MIENQTGRQFEGRKEGGRKEGERKEGRKEGRRRNMRRNARCVWTPCCPPGLWPVLPTTQVKMDVSHLALDLSKMMSRVGTKLCVRKGTASIKVRFSIFHISRSILDPWSIMVNHVRCLFSCLRDTLLCTRNRNEHIESMIFLSLLLCIVESLGSSKGSI